MRSATRIGATLSLLGLALCSGALILSTSALTVTPQPVAPVAPPPLPPVAAPPVTPVASEPVTPLVAPPAAPAAAAPLAAAPPAKAHLVLPGDDGQHWQHQWFTTSDKVKLHYISAGDANKPTLVLVTGWTMPAAIWAEQINYFARDFHVVAFDPRGQGESEIAATGYHHARRTQDLAEFLKHLGPRPMVLAGWSLGVLEVLSYVATHDHSQVQGLVLIDNSVGEGPPPPASIPVKNTKQSKGSAQTPRPGLSVCSRQFVETMFRIPKSPAYIAALTRSCTRLPPAKSAVILQFTTPRSHWRNALYAFKKPVLYLITPRWKLQATLVKQKHPLAHVVIAKDAGHAIFVDNPKFVSQEVCKFINELAWGKNCKDENGQFL